jgi:MFS transporter, DHA2 family, multidrug resistance protein
MLDRHRGRAGVSAVGYAVLAQVGTDGIATLVTGAVVVSSALGPMTALATDMVVASAPPQRAGTGPAISATAPQLGGALGIAVLGNVITAVYRTEVAADIPVDVPHDATAAAPRQP